MATPVFDQTVARGMLPHPSEVPLATFHVCGQRDQSHERAMHRPWVPVWLVGGGSYSNDTKEAT